MGIARIFLCIYANPKEGKKGKKRKEKVGKKGKKRKEKVGHSEN